MDKELKNETKILNLLKKAQKITKKYDQSHLLYFYKKLDETQKNILINQILNTDFKSLKKLYINSYIETNIDYSRISPVKYFSKESFTEEEIKKYTEIGEKIIEDEKLAIITLAGGQGTRLGFKGPKGCYELDLDKKEFLFEIISDKLKKVYIQYGVYLNWYIMTSVDNDEATKEYFNEKNFFEYPKEKIFFFKQDTIEIMDKNGKVLLDSLYTIKRASNGNGDVFRAFERYKLEKTLNNIEWISVSGIDNIILEIVDPLLIGLTISNKSSVASKSISKKDIESKDYVFAKIDNLINIIDPNDLSKEQKYSKNNNGQYNYNQINILSHLFNKKTFLQIVKLKLPYHRAFKKNDYIDNSGMKVVVKEPNSFKFEKFIFDAFKYTKKFTLLEVKETDEFAPIKSFTGEHTPETALDLYCKKYNLERKED